MNVLPVGRRGAGPGASLAHRLVVLPHDHPPVAGARRQHTHPRVERQSSHTVGARDATIGRVQAEGVVLRLVQVPYANEGLLRGAGGQQAGPNPAGLGDAAVALHRELHRRAHGREHAVGADLELCQQQRLGDDHQLVLLLVEVHDGNGGVEVVRDHGAVPHVIRVAHGAAIATEEEGGDGRCAVFLALTRSRAFALHRVAHEHHVVDGTGLVVVADGTQAAAAVRLPHPHNTRLVARDEARPVGRPLQARDGAAVHHLVLLGLHVGHVDDLDGAVLPTGSQELGSWLPGQCHRCTRALDRLANSLPLCRHAWLVLEHRTPAWLHDPALVDAYLIREELDGIVCRSDGQHGLGSAPG